MRQPQSVIRNQRGSILLVVFTISVVIAFMLPSLYFLMLKSATSQSRRGDVESYEMMMRSLKSQLEDPLNCHTLLAGQEIPNAWGHDKGKNGLVLDFKYGYTLDKDGDKKYDKGPVKAGWKIPLTQVTIEKVRMVRSGPNAGRVNLLTKKGIKEFLTVPLRIYLYPKELSINLGDLKSGPPESPELLRPMVRRDIMIRLLANVDQGNGKIYNCFGFESYAATCQNMGAGFNHLGPPELLCQPDKICFTGQKGMITNPDNCDTVGKYQYRALLIGESDGKKQYICSLCLDDLKE